jgi:hypothetical protein
MKKGLPFLMILVISCALCACAAPLASIPVPTPTPSETAGEGLPLVWNHTETIAPQPLSVLDESNVDTVFFTAPSNAEGVAQGLYTRKDAADDYSRYSFLEIGGVKYDLGNIGSRVYVSDAELGNFAFSPVSFSSRDAKVPQYSQNKSFGAAYVSTGYYSIADGVPYFWYEVIGMSEYGRIYNIFVPMHYDFDGDGVDELLAGDFAVISQLTIYKWDLDNGRMLSCNLNELLGADGMEYSVGNVEEYNLFRTWSVQDGFDEPGSSYHYKDGVFWKMAA